jgi:serine/threonine-protein kinase
VPPPVDKGSSDDLTRLLADVSSRLLTESDLDGRSSWELRLIRNTPFARHGYKFHDHKLADYFSKQWWYIPETSDADSAWKKMSATEQYNAQLVRSYQQRHGK